MRLYDLAFQILSGGNLEDKLISVGQIDWCEEHWKPYRFETPERNRKIAFSNEQIKFPGKGALQDKRQRGKALHFFANHELLAIEMMAQAILLFPEMNTRQQKLLVKTLSEEQKHLSLYLKRMKELGVEFGDFPLNKFFWSFMEKIHTPHQFFAVISLTFEQANLDFSKYYRDFFESLGDVETTQIMQIVYDDEIKHVARGRHEITQELPREFANQLWEYYCQILPPPLTPSRAKGMIFDEEGRKMAGLSSEFINSLHNYRTSFVVTERKEWEK